jgi:hypothetical protein
LQLWESWSMGWPRSKCPQNWRVGWPHWPTGKMVDGEEQGPGLAGKHGVVSHLALSLSVRIYEDGHSVYCGSPHAFSVPSRCPYAALYKEPPHPASIMAAVNVSSLPLDYIQANQGPKVDVICIIAFTLAAVAVVLRFLTRILTKASLWWDDWAVLIALVGYTALA